MEQKLTHYQVEDMLGEGSFAWVYRAFDEKFERPVALKVLKPMWFSDPQAIARFKQEAKTMAKLRHPHIVDVYDVGEAEGQIYLAQLLVEGQTLANRLTTGSLTWDEVVKIVTDIGSALDYAHNQGIIHRDIKPQNILLDKENHAYLGDFGLVRAVEGSTQLSSTMSMVGTAHYMAPEVWDGKNAMPTSDIYALSCVVFEMLTGKVLFEGSSMAAVTKQHIVGPQFPEQWPENVPEGITEVLRRGLAENPAERFGSAGELAGQLAALRAPAKPASPLPVVASTEPVIPMPTAKSGAPWLLIGGAVVIILVIAVIAFFALSGNGDEAGEVAAVSTPAEAPVVVPPLPSSTSTPTPVPDTPTSTHTPTSTPTSIVTPTDTPTLIPTSSLNSTPTATSVPTALIDLNGYYYLQTMFLEADNKCLEGNRLADESPLSGAAYMDDCTGVSGQLWKLVPADDDYYYLQTMFLEADNKCLEGNRLADESPLSGAAYMDDCSDVSGQLWKLVSVNDGYYYFQTMYLEAENKCLEGNRLAEESPLGGAAFMDDCGGAVGQLWKLVPAP